jgi:hypothetical protein
MTNFRITYWKNENEIETLLFTTKVKCKSMRGAKTKAKNLEPFDWSRCKIANIDTFDGDKYLDFLGYSNK